MNLLQSSLHSNALVDAPATQKGLISRARSPFWLAPMAGITDICFRQLMDEMHAGVLISELVSAKGLFFNSEKIIIINQGIKRYISKCEIIKGACTEFLE